MQKGVAPVADSVARHCEQQWGRKAAGLWSFVAAFRAEKKSARAKGADRAKDAAARDCRPSQVPPSAAVEDESAVAKIMIDMAFK